MPAATPRPGDVVAGRYRIEAEIGQGGFGAVYRATHVTMGRAVALKMLLPEMLQHDQGLTRFRREAELAQKLEHPNTVRLYDFGQTEHGLPFIAFELLRGEPLDKVIARERALSPQRVVRIVSQVLKSLMEAHALGIVHRDIKPGNIFLCEFSGETDYVKVLDFGIAKSTTSNTQVTQFGSTIGTPNYMSPEQVRGEQLGPAADLYSLGLTMAEMLTGRMVFQGEGTAVCVEQLAPQPVPLAPELLQSPLHRVLVTSTQKDLSRRYRSAADMLRDLDACSAALHSLPPPNPYVQPSRQWPTVPAQPVAPPLPPRASSNALPFLVIGIVGVLFLGGLGLALVGRGSHRQEKHAVDVDDEDTPKKKKPKKVDDDDEPAPSKSIKQKLVKLGWDIVTESNTNQPQLSVRTYNARKGSQNAMVYVYDAENAMTLDVMAKSLSSQKGSAVRRSGKRLVWIYTFPADADLADDLADDLGL